VVLQTCEPRSAMDPADVGEHPDAELIARLRAGDEGAFRSLVSSWSPGMLRVARSFVRGSEAAEDVVQETWCGVLAGLDRFEGRSSLRTWTFAILTNQARSRGVKDARTTPISQLDAEGSEPMVDPDRFQGCDGERPGRWTSNRAPVRWEGQPEQRVLAREVLDLLERALLDLPARQRRVVTMRDVAGLSAEEVCATLRITPENQRVLLHRARVAVRAVLEDYYRGRLDS
jgi:RNA polymerase sigma-70 factor, ECF subfamily